MSNTFVGSWEVCLAKHTNSLQCYEGLRELRGWGSFTGTFASSVSSSRGPSYLRELPREPPEISFQPSGGFVAGRASHSLDRYTLFT